MTEGGRIGLVLGMELDKLFEDMAANGINLKKKSGFLAQTQYKKLEGIDNKGNDEPELSGARL